MKPVSAVHSVLIIAAVNLFTQGARFFFQALLSRTVTAEALGLYQLILSIQPVLMSLTAVGAASACTQLTARYEALGDCLAARQALRACLCAFLTACAALFLLFVPLRGLIADSLLGDPRSADCLLLLLPLVLLTGLENIHKSFFYGAGSVKEPAFAEIGEQLIRIGAVWGLLCYLSPVTPSQSVCLILLGMVLCELFSACTLTALARRALGQRTDGSRLPPRTIWRGLYAIALPVGGNALLGNLMSAWTVALIPRALIRSGLPAEDALASLGVLRGMTLPLLALPTTAVAALAPVLLPKIVHAAAHGRSALCRRQLDLAITAVALWSFPTAALLAVLAPALGELIFHREGVGTLALPFALEMILDALGGVLSVALCGLGKQRQAAFHSLLVGGLRLLLTWGLMTKLGLAGYAAATLLAALPELWLNGRLLHKSIGWVPPWFSALTVPALSALLSALCADLLLPVLASLGPHSACCGAFLFGLLVYLCSLTAAGITPAFF